MIKIANQNLAYVEMKNTLEVFRNTHPMKEFLYSGRKIYYLIAGSGSQTILLFHGAANHPELLFREILHYEPNYRVIAPFITNFLNLTDFSDCMMALLTYEHVGSLIVRGGSFGGMIAQAFFHRNSNKIRGLILSHTYPPMKEWARSFQLAYLLFKILPEKWLKKLTIKELVKLLEFDPITTPPETQARIQLYSELYQENFQHLITKRDILCEYHLVTEWNRHDHYSTASYQNWSGKVLVLSSTTDKGFPYLHKITAVYPNVEAKVFEGTGHITSLVQEDAYNQTIDAFLLKLN